MQQISDQQRKIIFFLMEAIPMCLGTTRIRQYPSNTTYYYYLLFRLTTCFDPTAPSSGLHYEPINVGNEQRLGEDKNISPTFRETNPDSLVV